MSDAPAHDVDAAQRAEKRARSARIARIVIIALAILEAALIFGAVIPSVLRKTSSEHPRQTTGASHG